MSVRPQNDNKRVAPPLDTAMEQVFEMIQGTEEGEENRVPVLFLWDREGRLEIADLVVHGGGAQFIATARYLILTHKPVVAILAGEAWQVEIDATKPLAEQDWAIRAWLERRAQGEPLGVVDLPPDYRSEVLTLNGEDEEGHTADVLYRIRARQGPGGKRRFERQDATVQRAQAHPLFLLSWARRNGLPEQMAYAALLQDMESAGLLRSGEN